MQKFSFIFGVNCGACLFGMRMKPSDFLVSVHVFLAVQHLHATQQSWLSALPLKDVRAVFAPLKAISVSQMLSVWMLPDSKQCLPLVTGRSRNVEGRPCLLCVQHTPAHRTYPSQFRQQVCVWFKNQMLMTLFFLVFCFFPIGL